MLKAINVTDKTCKHGRNIMNVKKKNTNEVVIIFVVVEVIREQKQHDVFRKENFTLGLAKRTEFRRVT